VTTTYTFTVTGMHCASCGLLIDDTLEDLPGVIRSTTSPRTRRTTVETQPGQATPAALIAAIAEAGYTATWEQP
jgi:Cu+-exporting ATPase